MLKDVAVNSLMKCIAMHTVRVLSISFIPCSVGKPREIFLQGLQTSICASS